MVGNVGVCVSEVICSLDVDVDVEVEVDVDVDIDADAVGSIN